MEEETSSTPKSDNVYTVREILKHNTQDSVWLIINGKVYDVTEYLDKHPGGRDKLFDNAGQDVSKQFLTFHKSKIPTFIAKNFEIGKVKITSLSERRALKQTEKREKDCSKTESKGGQASNEHEQEVIGNTEIQAIPTWTQKEKRVAKKDITIKYELVADDCNRIKRQLSQVVEIAGNVSDVGNLIYDAVFTNCAEGRSLFKSPKQVTAFRLITQVAQFVNHSENPEFIENEVYNLAMRHISYITLEQGNEYMQMIRDCIIGVIHDIIDEEWDDQAQHSWEILFVYIGRHLIKNLEEFGGKVSVIRKSWELLDSFHQGVLRQKSASEAAGGNELRERTGGFGETLYFN